MNRILSTPIVCMPLAQMQRRQYDEASITAEESNKAMDDQTQPRFDKSGSQNLGGRQDRQVPKQRGSAPLPSSQVPGGNTGRGGKAGTDAGIPGRK